MPAIASWSMCLLINSLRKCLRIVGVEVRIPCRRASSELCIAACCIILHMCRSKIHGKEYIRVLEKAGSGGTSTEASKSRETTREEENTKTNRTDKNEQTNQENEEPRAQEPQPNSEQKDKGFPLAIYSRDVYLGCLEHPGCC